MTKYQDYAGQCRELAARLAASLTPEDERIFELMAAAWENVASERWDILVKQARTRL